MKEELPFVKEPFGFLLFSGSLGSFVFDGASAALLSPNFDLGTITPCPPFLDDP